MSSYSLETQNNTIENQSKALTLSAKNNAPSVRLAAHAAMSEVQAKHLDHFKSKLRSLVNEKSSSRVNGKAASFRTQAACMEVAMTFGERLYTLGYQLREPENLKPVHIAAFVQDCHLRGLQAKTLQQYMSVLRRLCEWVGKRHLMPRRDALAFYLPDAPPEQLKVLTVAMKSKSWSEQGIDVIAKIKEADSQDKRFGAMLRLGLALGLRRKEQMLINPSSAFKGAQNLVSLRSEIRTGLVCTEPNLLGIVKVRGNVSKSGRPRDIEVLSAYQVWAIDYAIKAAGVRKQLCWPELNYAQAVNRYSYLMRKLGITKRDADCVGHGLRAEFAENMAVALGYTPPTLGGDASHHAAAESQAIRLRVSNNLGHSRTVVTGAYYGSHKTGFRPEFSSSPTVDRSYLGLNVSESKSEVQKSTAD